jgi:hypothetical protein
VEVPVDAAVPVDVARGEAVLELAALLATRAEAQVLAPVPQAEAMLAAPLAVDRADEAERRTCSRRCLARTRLGLRLRSPERRRP